MPYKHNYLALGISELKNFFDPIDPSKRCKKVVFRFVYDDSTKVVIIEAFGAKNDNKYILPPVPLYNFQVGITLGAGGKLYVSDLELSKKMYTDLGNPQAGDTHLIFYPVISSTNANSATYQVEWGGPITSFTPPPAGQAITGPELNPSPPADPS